MSRSPRNHGNGNALHNGAASTLPEPAAQTPRTAPLRTPATTDAPAEPRPLTSAAKAESLTVVPEHVAIIMDGNGRWARRRGLLRVAGHRNGVDAVRDCVRAAGELGVRYLTLYAFSVENWRRPRAETAALMLLLEEFLRGELAELMSNNVRLQAIGRLSDLPDSVRSTLNNSISATAANTGLTLILALSYSGRVEIMEAVRSIAADVRAGLMEPEAITDAVLENHLYTAAYPDPDLLIRTSGEMRLSNFLLWQLSYTEIHVTTTLWPDFRREHLVAALQDFASRQRRYGAL
ncbi:isoprenyl transferase [Verrucomicrobia bacterium LW23]|nr:isoprenyl transferase [Verrucomicrobia bacterium LW23]